LQIELLGCETWQLQKATQYHLKIQWHKKSIPETKKPVPDELAF
jgi:hypothetical protein